MSSVKKSLDVSEWNPDSVKYMQPRLNKSGGKSVSVISQVNRGLALNTPLMMTWGVSDFVNKEGEGNGEFKMDLVFPLPQQETPETDEFLAKLKQFEEKVLRDAVVHCQAWWGETMTYDVCKHTFCSFLKYSKDKETKKIDMNKTPSLRAKVPCYDGKWSIQIYDPDGVQLFPSEENELLTPVDLVPSRSNVACEMQCGGIWLAGKSWGIQWKIMQCIVNRPVLSSEVQGCRVRLSVVDREMLCVQKGIEPSASAAPAAAPAAALMTYAQDSDDDNDDKHEVKQQVGSETDATGVVDPAETDAVADTKADGPDETPVAAAATTSTSAAATATIPPPGLKKKIVKKISATSEPEEDNNNSSHDVDPTGDSPIKKKIIKKKSNL